MNKIAIHHRPDSFSSDWIKYCRNNNVPFKVVNCYDNDIIDQLEECSALMWHFHHANYKDFLFAKRLVFSVLKAGKTVFPDFRTAWHFDDKVGQKYLLESIGAPLVPTYIFYNKEDAQAWVKEAEFPKVFKLRSGAGSEHVKLVESEKEARRLINRAFGKGFSQYQAKSNLKERFRKFRNGSTGLWDLAKGFLRLGYTTDFDRVAGNEKGYVYFQDFISGNDHDIRVVVVGDKAFAIKRMVRENDFRASGSGQVKYEKNFFSDKIIQISFDLAKKINSQSLAIDFVNDKGQAKIVEVSFGYTKSVYEPCEGYWDSNLKWHEGPFNPQYWMVKLLLKKIDLKMTSQE